MKLLIADDEISTRIFLKRSAVQWGYEVIEALDGLEAMAILKGDDPPRIAVLDWMMPGLDGVEICSMLQDEPGALMIYTILLTSKSNKEDVMHALDRGAHDFLSKPVHVGELRSRIAVGKRLVEAHDRLRELDRQKDRFMGMAAHDLRNPLGYIITMTEMLTDENFAHLHEKQDQYLETMRQTAITMQNMVNDLLDVASIRSGTLKIKKRPASIIKVIKNSIRLLEQAAHNKEIKITTKFTTDTEFLFDPERIGQLVDNLLSNAIKFSPPGSEILVSANQGEHLVQVNVADQGPGLTDKDQQHLFGEFQPLSAKPTGNEKSTGLGLTIASKIIEVHAGTIQADNLPEGGACFSFTLPLSNRDE